MNKKRSFTARAAGLAVIITLLAAPTVAVANENEDEQVDLTVTIPATDVGAFTWAAPTSVALGTATVQGTLLQATSSALAVEVTDTRLGQPSWAIRGQATQFEHTDTTHTFSSAYLGWEPEITQAGAGATAGPAVQSGYNPAQPLVPIDSETRGLNSQKLLASAVAGHGGDPMSTGLITGHLTLQVPIARPPGNYESVLSLTATLGG